ncbi:MAG: sulfite reductase (NADPH) flavoprotein alpha-component [Verrucomicrobiales bacterium]|jgi:sulfite reductase (NADPH) flavoprotein alpha-component
MSTTFNRKNPCTAKLKKAQRLTEGCSEKDTWHYEISLEGSGLEFLPGDSLALSSHNDPALVDEVLAALGFSGLEEVPDSNKEIVPLRAALIKSYAITAPDKKLLAAVAEKTSTTAEFADLLVPEKKKELADWLWGREIIDILLAYPDAKFTAVEFVGFLKKLQVRLYSIASSLKAHPDEVHLTVATVTFESFGRKRQGVCSSWLADRINQETPMPCFITPGKGFRPPEPDDESPVIMCGPGTGIAPFRAFLQERKATSAKGKAWLFFGEIHESTCFFYNDEWEHYLADGTLDKLTTAWSRDQAEKIYVQNKIVEHAEELWQWFEQGAIFYICGDASRMAPDVDKALHTVVETAGGKTPEEAAEYIAQMHKDKRYRRDVY